MLDQVLFLFTRRRYASRVTAAGRGPILVIDQEDPEGGSAIVSGDHPERLLEVSEGGGLLSLDAPGVGPLRFDSADELDRFVNDLLSFGWENLHPDDYRIIP